MVMVDNIGLAVEAGIDRAGVVFLPPLKYRLALMLVAIGAKPMRLFGRVGVWCYRVDENAGSKLVKLVARGCGFPLLKLSNLLFQCLFRLQQRTILSLHRKHVVVERENDGL